MFMEDKKQDRHTDRDPDGQTADIDKTIEFVVPNGAQGAAEIVR
jgi:hypothetical protein